jgi:hypothetical protein
MSKLITKEQEPYVVNLEKIEGDGDFPCPKCHVLLSPDDTTENNYVILDAQIANDSLSQLRLQCKHCSSIIELTGFLLEL